MRLRGATQAFDAANELTSSTPDGGSATAYGYDTRGDRVSATSPAGGGLRMSKTVGGSATAFAWDLSGGLPLAVRDGPLSVVYGPGGLPLEQVAADGTAQWFFHDQLGSTRALTDSTGAVAGAWSYDPYGAVTSSSGTATRFGFAGEYADAETGFVYLRARYYDPATGQFLSRDPLVAVTRSAYGYVEGDPMNSSDPSGLADYRPDGGYGNSYGTYGPDCHDGNPNGLAGLGVASSRSPAYVHPIFLAGTGTEVTFKFGVLDAGPLLNYKVKFLKVVFARWALK